WVSDLSWQVGTQIYPDNLDLAPITAQSQTLTLHPGFRKLFINVVYNVFANQPSKDPVLSKRPLFSTQCCAVYYILQKFRFDEQPRSGPCGDERREDLREAPS